MNRLLSNSSLLLSLCTIVVGVSLSVSLWSGAWHWFARSGAIATLAGVVLSVRPLIRMGLLGWVRHQNKIDGGGAGPTPEELEADRQQLLDARAARLGALLAVAGTLVWAYGDLLGELVSLDCRQ